MMRVVGLIHDMDIVYYVIIEICKYIPVPNNLKNYIFNVIDAVAH